MSFTIPPPPGWPQVTVTDGQGLTGTETMTIVVGEPFSLDMSPESGKWVVGDTIQVNAMRGNSSLCSPVVFFLMHRAMC